MKVLFIRDAFIGDKLYVRGDYPQEVPDIYKDKLPKTAKAVDDKPFLIPEKPKHTQPHSLRDFDAERAASDIEQAIRNKDAAKHK